MLSNLKGNRGVRLAQRAQRPELARGMAAWLPRRSRRATKMTAVGVRCSAC